MFPHRDRTPSSARQKLERFSIDTSRARSNGPVVSYCARHLGLQEFSEPREEGQRCDIYWHSVGYADLRSVVRDGGRVNKFPGMAELTKKASLTQAIRSIRELFPAEYSFYPQSWILPTQLDEFKRFCEQRKDQGQQDQCYIVKPDEGAKGTGIYLIHSDEQLKETEGTSRQLVQEYVADPYLLSDGLKFDLRIYAIIKSINPLSIYVAREGMARFCTENYVRPSADNLGNLYAHLTNYSSNKVNGAYVHSKSLREQLRGSKRLLSTVFHQMEHKGVRTRRLWREIKLIIVRTVLAMVPEIMLNYEHHFADNNSSNPQCFQIMGFDILIRQNGHPILLEVNSAPSLSVEHTLNLTNGSELLKPPFGAAEQYNSMSSPSMRSIVDEMIKVPLVRDCLLLVLDQLEHHYTKRNMGLIEALTERKSNGAIQNDTARSYRWEETQSVDYSVTPNSKIGKEMAVSEDDLCLLRKAQKPHLSEIFPARYGHATRHLLVLHRAVYLYLQFVPVRQTILISFPAIKAFIRKCELVDVMSIDKLEAKFNDINQYFNSTGKTLTSGAPALPFHGFLQLLFHIANCKFPQMDTMDECGDDYPLLTSSVLQLFDHCDRALRRCGVRSARLRHVELNVENDEKQRGDENRLGTDAKDYSYKCAQFFLLPSRIPRQSFGISAEVDSRKSGNIGGIGADNQSRKRSQQQPIRTRSLPQKFGSVARAGIPIMRN